MLPYLWGEWNSGDRTRNEPEKAMRYISLVQNFQQGWI